MWLGRTACERADADLDGHARGALGGAGEVVAEPGDVGGEGGVDGAGGDVDLERGRRLLVSFAVGEGEEGSFWGGGGH